MIGSLVLFATKNLKWIALGLAVLAAVLIVKGHFDGDAKVRKKLADVQWSIDNPATGWRARLDQCHANEAKLDAEITAQNAAVDRLKADGDARAAAAAKAAQDALKSRQKSDALAKQLAGYQSADTCEAQREGVKSLVKGLST